MWIEEVRGALEYILRCNPNVAIHTTAKTALAAIPAEPEMIRLLRLLEDWCAGIGEIGRVLTMDDKILIGVIRQTIEREFGYKLPEEADSGQENDSPEKSQAG